MKHTIIIHIEYNGMQFLIAVPRFGITVHALINNCKVYQSRLNLNSKLQLYPPPLKMSLKIPFIISTTFWQSNTYLKKNAHTETGSVFSQRFHFACALKSHYYRGLGSMFQHSLSNHQVLETHAAVNWVHFKRLQNIAINIMRPYQTTK